MKLGIQVSNFGMPGGTSELGRHISEIARNAEQAGFASFWVMDHYFQIDHIGRDSNEMLEGYSVLAYVAAVTRRMQLGTMVTGAFYHQPGILAKTLTTLDVLSGGRAYLGIGAGWYERESLGLGVPFPSTRERFERLEETVQIVLQMWSGDVKPYEGRHYRLSETLNSPQPLRRPHPPILIGGDGEQKTLRLVAKYADACNLHCMEPRELPHKLAVLRRHCQDLGRDYDSIEKTALGWLDLGTVSDRSTPAPRITAPEFVDMLGQLGHLGFSHCIFAFQRPWEPALFELIAREVLPQIADL